MQKNKSSVRQKNGNHPITTLDRKTNEKNESNEWYLWDNIKLANLHIIGAPERPEREKGIKNVPEKIYGWKIPKLKEGNRYSGTGNTEHPKPNEPKHTPRVIIIKIAKDNERILKAAREKQRVSYKGAPMRLSTDFLKETASHKGVAKIRSNLQPRILYPPRKP